MVMIMNKTEERKNDHIKICLEKDVEYKKESGFGDIEFIHNALPELDFNKIDTTTKMFGKKIDFPFMITAITGGTKKAKEINLKLARAAQENNIAMGLGSQRAMLEKNELVDTYKVREVAPDIPIIGNIGIIQLKQTPLKKIEDLVSKVEADALAVHLNPLQEVIQPEGDKDFSGCLGALAKTCDKLSVPVIAKGTGAGISMNAALMLKNAGVKMIDIAGAGGSCWSKVEYFRHKNSTPGFEEWGIPTVVSVIMCCGKTPIISSGGVRSGIDVAKSLAIGADYAGAALPLLKANNPSSLIATWKRQLKTVMFLTGSKNIGSLKQSDVFITGKTAQMLAGMGCIITDEHAKGGK